MNIAWLRDLQWLGTRRTIAYARILAIIYVPILGFVAFSVIAKGIRLDFVSFWTAAQTTINSGTGLVYEISLQHQAQGGNQGFYPFMYPPPFLAFILPIGLISYFPAYIIWSFTTYFAYFLITQRLIPSGAWPIAVYPAALLNIVLGQNAALTTALFCGATLIFRSRPFASGILLGCFIFKPHLALLFPIALIAGRHWRVIAGASASSASLIIVSLLMFGQKSWLAFIANASFTRLVLESRPELWSKMTSLFAFVRGTGGPLWLAYGVQMALAILLATVLWRFWRSPGDDRAKFAILALCSVLATPYVLFYDLLLLIVPICWFTQKGLALGFLPWAKAFLILVYMLPVVTFGLSYLLDFNLAWCIILAFLIISIIWHTTGETGNATMPFGHHRRRGSVQ